MEYNNFPTTYKGVRFRSRLEARWAWMFDRLGWKWHYESVTLPGWIPDFVLEHVAPACEHDPERVFVEVKPAFDAQDFPASKFENALRQQTDLKNVVILGLGAKTNIRCHNTDEDVCIGWRWDYYPNGNDSSVLEFWPNGPAPFIEADGEFDFNSSSASFAGVLTGHYIGGRYFTAEDHLARIWNEAGNALQWNGR